MKIFLKSLTLKYFKGIRNLTIDFFDRTEISGHNGSGKTTIYDGFLWLLFGKDSQGSANFQVKTIDGTGAVIPKLDHTVKAVINTGGATDRVLSRTLREKWVKPRGQAEAEFAGHETTYSIDGIEVKAKDFNDLVAQWCEESVFRLVTDVAGFFRLKTVEQRQILLSVAGGISPEELTNGSEELAEMLEQITGVGYDLFRKSIRSKIKPIQNELDTIPARIQENRQLLEQITDDPEAVKAEIEKANQQIRTIDDQLQDASKRVDAVVQANKKHFDRIDQLQKEKADTVAKIKAEHREASLEADKELNEAKAELDKIKAEIKRLYESNNRALIDINDFSQDLGKIRERYKTMKEKVFFVLPSETTCGSCGQELPDSAERIQALESEFNKSKARTLEDLEKEGKQVKHIIEAAEKTVDVNDAKIKTLEETAATLGAQVADMEPATLFKEGPETAMIEADFDRQIEAEKAKIQSASNDTGANELRAQMTELQQFRDNLKGQLARAETRALYQERIEALEAMQREKGQAIADLEKQDFLAETLQRNTGKIIESRINDRLTGSIQFRLFRDLINGGQEETCECLIDGVPLASANTASQINAGVAVINLLQDHFKCVAPVFIDRAESVNSLLETTGQMIKLTVTTQEITIKKF